MDRASPQAALGGLIGLLRRAEDFLLVLVMGLMLCMAALQIVLRNFFDSGIFWADALLRIAVLWIALLGATIASRRGEHINIDVLTRILKPGARRFTDSLAALFTAAISAMLCYHSYRFVRFEYEDGIELFAGIPAWTAETILPLAFAIITLRYLLLAYAAMRFGRTIDTGLHK